jgi:glycosyltransferase
MKVSVVTAVFNRAATIGQAIASVHCQTYPNIEHVIQDGGSTDGTLDAISQASRGSPVSMKSETDSGIYDAVNKGISRASGDVIGLMHSDDFFASDDILSQVAVLFEDPQVQGVYGDLDYVAVEDTTRIIRRWRSGAYNRSMLKQGWMPPHPTLYLRREVFEDLGAYDTSYRIAADYDATLRWLWTGKIKLAYLPKVMVKMRVGGESNRSLGRILRKSREDHRALKSNGVGGAATLFRKNASKFQQFLPEFPSRKQQAERNASN